MVARICSANPRYREHRDLTRALIARADELRLDLLRARPRDEAAFEAVVAAGTMPKNTGEERELRRIALQHALREAAEEPLRSAQRGLDVLRAASQALAIPNRNLASDLGCAAEFAYAALAACAYNVRINHRFMHDAETIRRQAQALERCEREALAVISAVRRAVISRLIP